jgi:hypothetical protein
MSSKTNDRLVIEHNFMPVAGDDFAHVRAAIDASKRGREARQKAMNGTYPFVINMPRLTASGDTFRTLAEREAYAAAAAKVWASFDQMGAFLRAGVNASGKSARERFKAGVLFYRLTDRATSNILSERNDRAGVAVRLANRAKPRRTFG